ncbi:MAG: N-acetyltransferase [Caulobacteraceae bacterium]|nr:N-acetyltransferase [Caulobacteraceae bacterium]
MILRAGRPSDAESVLAVVEAAFGARAEAELVAGLITAGDDEISLVAQSEGRVVGHVLLSRMRAPFRSLALAPVSVAPAHQGRGVGSALVREAIDRARKAGWLAIFVLGAPAYYTRFGFDLALAGGFTSPYAGPHFMALALQGPLPQLIGDLRHAPAFATLDEAHG